MGEIWWQNPENKYFYYINYITFNLNIGYAQLFNVHKSVRKRHEINRPGTIENISYKTTLLFRDITLSCTQILITVKNFEDHLRKKTPRNKAKHSLSFC